MKLYHGSTEIVVKPEIIEPNRALDFGKGFYTITDVSQAQRWVRLRINNQESDIGFINIYEYQPAKELKVRTFRSKSELIKRWKTYKLVDQILFHTEVSLKCLTFIGYKEVKL